MIANQDTEPLTDRLEELLAAAALCFQARGYAATSIDSVARRMGATKGRVYHYFPSKMDLFNAVRERGMQIVFEATEPGYRAELEAPERLALMALGHVGAMFAHHAFMQVHRESLQMHRFGNTTPEQHEAMARHIEERDAYERRFREVVREGAENGTLRVGEPFAITIQCFMSALHSPVTWYSERAEDTPEKLERLAREVVRFAMLGLGVDLAAQSWPELPAPADGGTP
ncbi:MAG: TetR/AcrR family transcriptional regulator [Jhaorihella sp.]